MDKFFRAMPHTGCKRGMGPGFQNEKLLQQLGYSVCCAVQIIPGKGFNHAGVRLFGKFGVQRHFGQHGQGYFLPVSSTWLSPNTLICLPQSGQST